MGRATALSRLSRLARASFSALQNGATVELLTGNSLAPLSTLTQGQSQSVTQPPGICFPRPHLRNVSTTTFAANDNKDDSDEAFRELAEAFSGLITTAYELMAQDRPAEAEMLLQRGAQQAEEALGAGSIQVAPLWDQLALFQFMHDRCEEAQAASLKAWEAVRNFAAQEGSAEAKGAAATAAVRHATTLVGAGDAQAASKQLANALADLESALAQLQPTATGDDESSAEEAQQYIEKFTTARGEAQFYSSLCALAAIPDPSPEDVEKLTDDMEIGLRAMTHHLGPRHPLTACALREHNRLTEGAVESERGPLAESLYGQEIRLHAAFDPDGQQTAALYYQLGTLQYCHGRHEEAIRSLERCLNLLENEFEGAEEHLMTVQHRLGMALGGAGKHQHARDVFSKIAPQLLDKLGEGNPVTHELNFMTALMALRDLRKGDDDGIGREAALLNEMDKAVMGLKQFGEEHMLVKYAEKTYEENKRKQYTNGAAPE